MTVFDDEASRLDRVVAESAVVLSGGPNRVERVVAWAREAVSTPAGSAIATATGFSAVAAIAAAVTHATVSVSNGPLTEQVRCGLDVYVYGYPDRGVGSACRTAEAGRMAIFVPATLIVIAGLVAAIAVGARGRRTSPEARQGRWAALLGGVPVPAITVPIGLLGLVAALLALRPAKTEVISGNQLLSAGCGIDTYLFGHPDAVVDRACGRAYASHAHLFVGGLVVLAIVVGLMLRRVPKAFPGWKPQRLALAGAAAVLAVGAAVAFIPTQVTVNEGGAPATARCGLDSYVAGYPDHAIQSSCRHHYARHALAGVAASADAIACALAAWAMGRRRILGGTDDSGWIGERVRVDASDRVDDTAPLEVLT